MVDAISETSIDWGFETEEINKDPLQQAIHRALSDRELSDKIYDKLHEIGLTTFEKELGSGAYGTVIQVSGDNAFEGKEIALKIERFSTAVTNEFQELCGDALALDLPSGHHLGRAFGLLTYDGENVHYVESYDPHLHTHHLLIGTLSKAINGVSLYEKQQTHLSPDAVRGYGKQLAESLLALHSKIGYVHHDLHDENVLVKTPKEGKDPYRIKLLDFGLAKKITPKREKEEWRSFGGLLHGLDTQSQLNKNLNFCDLLYSKDRGLLNGAYPYSGNEILNHPFFA